MCYSFSLRNLLDLVNIQVELSTLPLLTELRKTQLTTQLTLERATETITASLVEQMTGSEAKKMADIKSATELITLAESMKIDSSQAKTKLAQIINAELELILLKYQKA